MKKTNLIIMAFALCLIGLSATAQSKRQYSKPLTPAHSPNASNDATYNIGITGGLTLTEWIHLGGSQTRFSHPLTSNMGLIGGLSFEKVLSNRTTVGIEALYAMRNVMLSHTLLDVPVNTDINYSNDIKKTLSADYTEIAVQAPFSYFFNNTPNATLRPFVFAAPRVTVPLAGTMRRERQAMHNDTILSTTYDTIAMSKQNFKSFNLGLVLGGGMMMRINLNNYYFLVRLDASYHIGLLNTHTKKEMEDNIGEVIGSSYIEPILLEKRFSTDANVKLTLFFPLKKQLKGACMSWGEYD